MIRSCYLYIAHSVLQYRRKIWKGEYTIFFFKAGRGCFSSLFFFWHVYSLRVLLPLLHFAICLYLELSLQSSTSRIFKFFSITSIHLFLGLPQGLFPCGFHSKATLTVSFFPLVVFKVNFFFANFNCFQAPISMLSNTL